MRTAIAGLPLLALAFLVLAACGGPEQAEGPSVPEVVATPTADGGAVKVPATIADTLTIICGKPFSQDATAGTLAEIFGAQNVIPETIDGPEGEQVNVTAIYPQDRSRRIEVTFANEEERTVLTSVTIRGEVSEWTGPGGLNLGDGIETVERALDLLGDQGGLREFPMTDEADDGFLLRGKIENPLVVFHQRTGLDDDGFLDAMRRCHREPVGRQHGAVQRCALARPRHATGTRGIIEMRVRVDDARRRRCGLNGFMQQCSGGGGLEKAAAVHAERYGRT